MTGKTNKKFLIAYPATSQGILAEVTSKILRRSMFARSFPLLPLLSDSWRRSPLHIVQSSNSTHQVLALDILPRGDSDAPS